MAAAVGKRSPVAIGEGSEPPWEPNLDPPRMPGRSDDVDPHRRVENVALEPGVVVAADGSTAFLEMPQQGPVPAGHRPVAGYVGLVERLPDPAFGRLFAWEPDGDPYLVLQPWFNVILADQSYMTAKRDDTVVLLAETAARGLETGMIQPL